jgi:hypothetical protein
LLDDEDLLGTLVDAFARGVMAAHALAPRVPADDAALALVHAEAERARRIQVLALADPGCRRAGSTRPTCARARSGAPPRARAPMRRASPPRSPPRSRPSATSSPACPSTTAAPSSASWRASGRGWVSSWFAAASPRAPLVLFPLLAACASTRTAPPDAFLDGVARHCGQAHEGRIVADEPPPSAGDPFTGKRLVMHVRDCAPGRLAIAFHVGEDRSRTWVLTRTSGGLLLEHDHRHRDGSPDVLTLYGGETRGPGRAARQEFPASAASRALFEREGRAVSVSNVWAMEIEPGRRFVYELTRPGRRFRVEFDLTRAVPPPPAPWGHRDEPTN